MWRSIWFHFRSPSLLLGLFLYTSLLLLFILLFLILLHFLLIRQPVSGAASTTACQRNAPTKTYLKTTRSCPTKVRKMLTLSNDAGGALSQYVQHRLSLPTNFKNSVQNSHLDSRFATDQLTSAHGHVKISLRLLAKLVGLRNSLEGNRPESLHVPSALQPCLQIFNTQTFC